MEPFNWTCQYCGQATTITGPNISSKLTVINTTISNYGYILLGFEAISCPNPECTKLTLTAKIVENTANSHNWLHHPTAGEVFKEWQLLPQSHAKPQPDYIPESIRKTYTEACLVCNESPTASATLSRRCLQGIVRDYWEIPENNCGKLAAEIKFIKDKIDPATQDAIHAIMRIGNIGAHMEKDVDVMIDVEKDEADLLIQLVEMLLEDWYVTRHRRKERSRRAIEMVADKNKQLKAAKKKTPEPAAPAVAELR